MQFIKNLGRVLILGVFSSILLSGCSAVNHKVGSALNLDTDLKLEIVAAKDLNPDEQNSTSPVFLWLYELSSTQAFESADFIDLYERDEEILADSFIAKQELKAIVPNSTRTDNFVLSKDTRHVALFAQFYRYTDAKAKVVFPITASNVVRNTIKIELKGNTIRIVEE